MAAKLGIAAATVVVMDAVAVQKAAVHKITAM